jgi:MFS family permease
VTETAPFAARPQPTRAYRWVVLVLISLGMFGNYYVFDALNPVGPLLESTLQFTQAQIGLLDTGYNVAALLILLAGGVIIDRAGTRRGLAIFATVTFLGGVLIAAGSTFPIMLAGRFVLGLGAEPLIVAITTALAKWFKGKELAFAMGVNLTIGRLGSVAADNSATWASPLFSSWQPPLVLAAGVGFTCIASAVAYWMLERRAERRFALGSAGESDRLVLADLVRFGRAYWWIVGLCVAFYSAMFPFRRFANIYFTHAHGVSPETAGFLNGLLPLTAMVATPLFGLLADRIGRRGLLMAGGSCLLLPTFLLLAYTPMPVGVPMAMMGVAFSLVPAVMWPAVAYLVDEKRLGTAYALMTFCQQIGWALVSWAVGALNDYFGASAAHPGGYLPGLWLFSTLGLFALFCAYHLWRTDRASGDRR